MASVADESIASVPPAQLAWMREEILQATTSMPQSSGVVILRGDGIALSAGVAATAPQPAPAPALATPVSPRVPPRMGVSKSASAVEMEAMLHPSPSQEAFATMTRASSFPGFPGGDTQPMESQVYRDFNTSMMQAAAVTTPAKAMAQLSANAQTHTYDTLSTDKTPRTCVEGDTGYIDLENAVPSPGAQSTSSFIDDLATSPQTQLAAESGTALTFARPETPALAGHKRRHSGEILTSAATTSKHLAFSQVFGGVHNAPMLSATQAFDQTQAPSSPLPDGPRSDPIMTRPSPTLYTRPDVSSPAKVWSSPATSMRPSTAGGLRDVYTSVRESQERRAARLGAGFSLPPNIDDDDFLGYHEEQEADAERRSCLNKLMQRMKSDQALLEFAKVRAPSRSNSRPTSSPKPSVVIDLTTPAVAKRAEDDHLEVSDDEHAEDGYGLPEDDELAGFLPSDDDEYDELGQTVLTSQGEDQAHEPTSGEDDKDVDANLNDISNTAGPKGEAVADADIDSIHIRTQQVAVANSQPMHAEQTQEAAQQRVQPPSPISSFVPGSQYTGKTSQEQAQHSKGMSSTSLRPFSSHVHPLQHRLSSSPPLCVPESTEPELVDDHQANKITRQIEIPESEVFTSDIQRSSSCSTSAKARVESDSNAQVLFSTAQSHLSQPGRLSRKASAIASPLKRVASQQSKNTSQSPLTAAGVRRFSDIAGLQSPPRASNETDLNLDAIMNDVITEDDQDFLQAVSTPTQDRPLKRRRMANSDAETNQDVNRNSKSNSTARQVTELDSRGLGEDSIEPDPDRDKVGGAPITTSTKPLQKSPGRAYEMLTTTADSVQEREAQGAKAVSQLIWNRDHKPYRHSEIKDQTKASAKKDYNKRRRARSAKATVVENDIATSGSCGTAEDAEAEAEVEAEVPQVVDPRRVFTLFKGQYNNFYTATWINVSSDARTHFVRFDDGTEIHIEPQHIRRLELCVGDQVKVNVNGMRNKTWVVAGYVQPSAEPNGPSATDVFGRSHLLVQAKSSRVSAMRGEGELLRVAIADVYLTHTIWPHFAERAFNPPSAMALTNSRAATPSAGVLTPNIETPTSRSRRGLLQATKAVNSRSLHLRDEPQTGTDLAGDMGLFAGMAFAISYGSNENEKLNVIRLIQRNGGVILECGFDELFDLPTSLDASSSSPSKKSPKKECPSLDEMSGLKLQTEKQRLGFVALIADRHSRRAKYMQALALGVPTLSGRWVIDSLALARNPSLAGMEAAPLPWARYLLPAGESSFLGGAIRSRTISDYPAKGANLSHMLANRSLLLDGTGVLIVAPKKGKSAWERRKVYAFLTLALGAGRVKRVADAQEARAWTNEEPESWRWIYVDGSVAEASSIVFGKGIGGGKKRKREDEETRADANATSKGNGKVTVVNDEFVIQSLILGALID